ncbi:MAG TPA: cytidylate kinase-like family protein [Spirochaetota bacterium]|nr:cytidylate kinase-like family protein [Spirochaetota bacterium]
MTAALDRYITAQVTFWKHQKETIEAPEKKSHLPFITISREFGCCGYDVAQKIVEIINAEYKPEPLWAAYDRVLIDKVTEDMGLSTSLTETLTGNARNSLTNLFQTTFSKFPPQVAVYRRMAETIAMLAANGNAVIVGRGGNLITRNVEGGFHLRIVAPLRWRADNMAEKMKMSKSAALKEIDEKEKQRASFFREFLKHELTDPLNYDMLINNFHYSTEEAARLIIDGLKVKGFLK